MRTCAYCGVESESLVLAAKSDMRDGLYDLEVHCAARRHCYEPETVWDVLHEVMRAANDDEALGHRHEVASIALEIRRARDDMSQPDMLAASLAALRRVTGHEDERYARP